jgi:nucleoside-diphosphate-sugar epimerase
LPLPIGDRDTVDDKMKNVVDVRDVAEALVRVYETPEASGRYICRSYPMSMTEILDIIKSFYPNLSYPNK